MSDGYIEDEYDEDDTSIKGLRRAANRAKKLEAEMDSMKRELAFARAGLPLDDPSLAYFVKGYDGDLEAESILEAAEQAGFIEIVEDDEYEEPQQQAYQDPAQDRVMAAAAGGMAENVTEAAALSRMEDALKEGGVDAMLSVAQEYGVPISSDETI
jgi:hypothetical protein